MGLNSLYSLLCEVLYVESKTKGQLFTYRSHVTQKTTEPEIFMYQTLRVTVRYLRIGPPSKDIWQVNGLHHYYVIQEETTRDYVAFTKYLPIIQWVSPILYVNIFTQ